MWGGLCPCFRWPCYSTDKNVLTDRHITTRLLTTCVAVPGTKGVSRTIFCHDDTHQNHFLQTNSIADALTVREQHMPKQQKDGPETQVTLHTGLGGGLAWALKRWQHLLKLTETYTFVSQNCITFVHLKHFQQILGWSISGTVTQTRTVSAVVLTFTDVVTTVAVITFHTYTHRHTHTFRTRWVSSLARVWTHRAKWRKRSKLQRLRDLDETHTHARTQSYPPTLIEECVAQGSHRGRYNKGRRK